MPGAGAYAATKGAPVALMHTLAMEQAPRNIRVNSISPGIIGMPVAEEALDPALAAHARDRNHPGSRMNRPVQAPDIGVWPFRRRAMQPFPPPRKSAPTGAESVPGACIRALSQAKYRCADSFNHERLQHPGHEPILVLDSIPILIVYFTSLQS